MSDDLDRDRRHQVWAALHQSAQPLGVGALARRLSVHPNTIRFHLAALRRAGRVEQVADVRSGPGRPAQRYRAVAGMDPAGPRHYQVLARLLADSLAAAPDAAARATAAGRAWGSRLAADRTGPVAGPTVFDDRNAVSAGEQAAQSAGDRHGASVEEPGAEPLERLVALLAELDFGPEQPEPGADVVRLRHCPFLELARQRAAVVCPIHLGLMQGALAAWHAELTVDRLQPFAEPDLCTAHLAVAS